jgi:hypothetical protein
MASSPILVIHVCAGIVGLLSGAAAVLFQKGSPLHVLAGRIFVASMLVMSAAGASLGAIRHEPGNIAAGIVTIYLVGTAWLTARRRDGETSRFDWIVLMIPLGAGILNWINGFQAIHSPTGAKDGIPAVTLFLMGSIYLIAAAGDIRMLVFGGVRGTGRIARHLWRMCFGLFIAAGSFLLGGNDRPRRLLSSVGLGQHLPSFLFNRNVYFVLTFVPVILLIFWLVRIRLANASKSYLLSRDADTSSLA